MISAKLFKIGLFSLAFFMAAGRAVAVQQCPSQFISANGYYKDGKYAEAVEAYEVLVSTGVRSGNLFYNLGNAYFKKGDLGRALLNYERANLFIPGDQDLRSNYDFAAASLNVPVDETYGPRLFRWIDRLYFGMGIDIVSALSALIWFSILAILSAALFIRSARKIAVSACGALIVVLVMSLTALSRKVDNYERGAVAVAGSDAKFEPNPSATTYFVLSEGSRVRVLDRASGWAKITRYDGKIGWVKAETVQSIKPAVK